MKNCCLLIYCIFLVSVGQLYSQPILSLEEAISIALIENYGIRIAKMEQNADEMQVYKSNAGYGPTVDWTANMGLTGNNVNQTFIDGRGVSRFGRAINPNTSVNVGITLYDGGRMEATYDRLGKLSELTELQGKVVIQNTILQVMGTYYDIIRQKERVSYLETIIKNYEERLAITEERWNVGRGSKLDFLQSKTDLNAQLAILVGVKNDLKNAKITLNGLLTREAFLDFDVALTPVDMKEYDLTQLMDVATDKNRDILLLQKAWEISLVREKEIAADRAPQVGFIGSTGFTYSNTNAGFLQSNRSIAINVGVSARWNIFDGHHRKNQIAISKINTEIIQKQQESLEVQLVNDLSLTYNQYQTDKELLNFEILNREIALENLTISLEKFRLGGSTILELNEAQRAYDTALNRLVDAQFNIKLSELELLRLSGTLVD